MYIARGLLILSFGSMLRLTSCYSDGSILADQCQAMNIIHRDGDDIEIPAQDTESPFKIEPESVKLNVSVSNITVTLSGGSGFSGFMLDSREKDNGPSVGTFSLEDLDNTQLICGDRVVVHVNNVNKNSIRVFWTPPTAASGLKTQDTFFFRAAVVENYFKFWRRKPIIVTSITPPPTETSVHTGLKGPPNSEANSTDLTTTTTKFTTSNKDSQAPGTSTAPPNSEANSTDLTTTTTKFTTSNKDSQAPGTSTAPPNSEANSTDLTTTTTKFTTSNKDSQAPGTSIAPPNSEANSTDLTTTTTKFTTSNQDSQVPALLTGTSAAPKTEANITQTTPTTSKTRLASIVNKVQAFIAGKCSWSISQAISINITSDTSIFVSISNVFQAPVCCSCRNLWDPLNTLYAVLMFWSYILLL